MMPTVHSGAISFGLVHIPVQLFRTTRDTAVSFNQLCKETHQRVRYRKFCPGCKRELKPDEIVRGYQFEKDRYIVLDDEELEALKSEQDRNIHILQFVHPEEIGELYIGKNFYVIPQPHAEKAYELLRKSMQASKTAAIAKTVMGTRETLMALFPREDDILCRTLFYQDELTACPQEIAHPRITKAESDMARQLIHAMTAPFSPERFHDEYQERLREAIAQKIKGQQIIRASETHAPASVLDLMDALQQSVAASKVPVRKRRIRH